MAKEDIARKDDDDNDNDVEAFAGGDTSFVPMTAPKWALFAMSAATLLSGSFNTILQKWMNKHEYMDGGDCDTDPDACPRFFEAPYWQTFLMFFGEWFCMGVWLIDSKWLAKPGRIPRTDLVTSLRSLKKPHCPFYWWLVPTVIDYVASTLINFAFVIGHASTIQMFRNFNVAVTALLTILYLRVALRTHHWVGVAVLSAGMVVVGIYAILEPDEETNVDSSLAWLGIVMAVLG
eukprot:Trichotokara_eunicae@DN6776_c0_g1_i1.p1